MLLHCMNSHMIQATQVHNKNAIIVYYMNSGCKDTPIWQQPISIPIHILHRIGTSEHLLHKQEL